MVPTFLNAPHVQSLSEIGNIKGCMGFLGIPWDLGSIYGKGAAQAPVVIRKASQHFDGYHLECDLSLAELPLVDLGDISQADFKTTLNGQTIRFLQDCLREIYSTINILDLLLIAGGDHLITAASFLPTKPNNSVLLWVDAHLDLMDAYPNEKKWTNSTVLRRTIELSTVSHENIWIIGTHGYDHGPEELEYVRKYGIHYFPLHKLRSNKKSILEKILNAISEKEYVYMSVDIDVLDPAYAPGTLARAPGGLTPQELFHLIRKLAPYLDVLDLVEIYPNHDPLGITAEIAAATLIEACAYRFHIQI
ncbi:MAG: arginase family protein [Candidatus Heimdallarchaeota archaeon]